VSEPRYIMSVVSWLGGPVGPTSQLGHMYNTYVKPLVEQEARFAAQAAQRALVDRARSYVQGYVSNATAAAPMPVIQRALGGALYAPAYSFRRYRRYRRRYRRRFGYRRYRRYPRFSTFRYV